MKIAGSEEKSEEFLRAKGILKTFKLCPFCGDKSISRVRRKSFKCYNCRREQSIRKDSILEDLKVTFLKLSLAFKHFVLEVPVNRACRELEIAYNERLPMIFKLKFIEIIKIRRCFCRIYFSLYLINLVAFCLISIGTP